MTDRTEGSRAPTPFGLIGLYGALALLGTGLAVAGLANGNATVALIGGVGAFVALAAAPVAFLVRRAPAEGSADLGALALAVQELSERQALSDDARRVLSRKREREILCRAIEEDIATGDWSAATVLVKELAERFGYRAEAEGFRDRIEHARDEIVHTEIEELIRGLDRLILQLKWEDAEAEAARITRLYPDSPRTEGLRRRVSKSRERYKADLERRFLHLAREERVDEAFEILKELDQYLTEAEAAPLAELARGVVGKARENLGVQFKLAYQDKDWTRCNEVGERIISEFPNTRMAEEVRAMIDFIRDRAMSLQNAGL